MKYEVRILETGHCRHYKSIGSAIYYGKRLLFNLLNKGLISGDPEFEVRNVETGYSIYIKIKSLCA